MHANCKRRLKGASACIRRHHNSDRSNANGRTKKYIQSPQRFHVRLHTDPTLTKGTFGKEKRHIMHLCDPEKNLPDRPYLCILCCNVSEQGSLASYLDLQVERDITSSIVALRSVSFFRRMMIWLLAIFLIGWTWMSLLTSIYCIM
jgi:hypothetical protein